MSDDNRKLVYSSEDGFREEPKTRRTAPHAPSTMPADGIVRIARERRRASVVTLVHGLGETEVVEVAKTLKRLCGTGGTAKNEIVEIQGDHRDKIHAWFSAQGRKVKLAGG